MQGSDGTESSASKTDLDWNQEVNARGFDRIWKRIGVCLSRTSPTEITVVNEKGSCLSPKLRRETKKSPTEIDQMLQEMEEFRSKDEINEWKYKVEN